MTNVRLDSIDDDQDSAPLNLYCERTAAGVAHDAMMKGIWAARPKQTQTPTPTETTEPT